MVDNKNKNVSVVILTEEEKEQMMKSLNILMMAMLMVVGASIFGASKSLFTSEKPNNTVQQYVLTNVSNMNTIAKNVTFYDINNNRLSTPIDLKYTGNKSTLIPVNAVKFSIDGEPFNLFPNESNTIFYDNQSSWVITSPSHPYEQSQENQLSVKKVSR